jgi:adenine deaminase
MMTFTFAPSARFDDQPAPFPFHTHREMLAHPNVVRWAKLPNFARFDIADFRVAAIFIEQQGGGQVLATHEDVGSFAAQG